MTKVFIKYPRMRLLDHMVIACLLFKETTGKFSSVTLAFYIPTSTIWVTQFLSSSPAFGVINIFYYIHSARCVVISHFGFNWHFLMADLFIGLFAISLSSSVKCLFTFFAHFNLNCLFFCTYSYYWNCKSVLYILYTVPFWGECLQIFSYLSFQLSFKEQKF